MAQQQGTAKKSAARTAGCLSLMAAGALLLSNDATTDISRVLRTETSSEKAVEHKIGKEDSGVIWIVNQPKCGTGSLEQSVHKNLGCAQRDGATFGDAMPAKPRTRFFDCPGEKKLFRSHWPETAGDIKKIVDAHMESKGSKPEKCIVITAVRNPELSIPSRFFEPHKRDWCDGEQSKEFVTEEYEKYLESSGDPAMQADTTAQMLKAFGVTDIVKAMERLTDTGYAFFDEPEEDGPWAGCELLFLQIDYEENNKNLDRGLDHAVEGVTMLQNMKREEQCPMAADNYHTLIEHGVAEHHIDRYSESNPEIRELITYYRNVEARV
eukprot:CAMPEP_0183297426 /NCGR_PEP_ID=MMETSP0160_2-20130417/4731_1 /TAXON_ID=2839 ORGANISM="Odontella Sinensis, Strain Grunow 1884" /NCGR_SAMPLE_ID=MMETSP0160_2 /ASSEMBLY_ACC=CAM_ASM_000250 /LENGTH=323 /DNA_ID=CAMNT_0025459251 /DNA_START=16 /DNA_END=987 /DNA_ORIENTATION=+